MYVYVYIYIYIYIYIYKIIKYEIFVFWFKLHFLLHLLEN